MHFDERDLRRHHVHQAIRKYLTTPQKHYPARSAFLINHGQKLPAKHILKMAFEELTGVMPKSEQITGGRASVRVLRQLGFDAIYEKLPKKQNKNPIKSQRREAFREILGKRWGEVKLECSFPEIKVPDLDDRKNMNKDLLNILNAIESERNIEVKGRKNFKLKFDMYLPEVKAVVEFDERQHFTALRAASLKAYPPNAPVGFDLNRWVELSEKIRAGDNSPIYRDEQRAFYDSIRDIMSPQLRLRPVIRVFEEDVFWERVHESRDAEAILREIKKIIER